MNDLGSGTVRAQLMNFAVLFEFLRRAVNGEGRGFTLRASRDASRQLRSLMSVERDGICQYENASY